MNILVINGSPKGEYSVTLKTSEYLAVKFPEHFFTYIHPGRDLKKYERDFSDAKAQIENADIIIFSYPVYTFLVPSQLHKFIELMKQSGADLKGKYVSQISTSKHFYDVTAHKFIEENMKDMGMKYVKGLSADMDDLTKKKGQKEAEEFMKFLIWSKENDICSPIPKKAEKAPLVKASATESETEYKLGDVVIVADLDENDEYLASMIDRFRALLQRKSRLVNLREVKIKGGCLGCLACAVSEKCVYKDGFDDFLRNEIQSGEAIVYAFSIKDHSMGGLFKTYDDRQFCNGHRTVTMGKPIGYIVSGAYSKEDNLKTLLTAKADVGGNYLCGIATNETDPDSEIRNLAKTLDYAILNRYTQPQEFYGVGGAKIFRDLIYMMQGFMKADHKFYKEHGQYDFPQKKRGTMLGMYLVGALVSNEKVKSKMKGNMMSEGMLMPYNKVIKDAGKKK